MNKFGLIFFLVTVCWQLTLSELDIGNELPTKGKASLFLQKKAIPGIEASVSPEDLILRTKDYLLPEMSPFVDYGLRSSAAGNYPGLNLQIIKPKMPSSVSKKKKVDDSEKKLILLDPVEELLLGRGHDIPASDNETAPTDPTDQSDLIEPESTAVGFANFARKILECKVHLNLCSKKNIIACYLHCLLNNHPIGKIVKSNVNALVRTLCDPLGTVFDVTVKLFDKNFDNIKSISHFLTLLGIKAEAFKRFTRLAANSIPAIVLKYAKVQGSDLFKTVIGGLQTDSKALVASTTDIGKALANPGCPVLDTFNAVQRVVGIIYQNPKLVDIFFPGLWMLSKVFNLIEVPLLKVALQAVGGALSMLVGINCGLVHYIQTGNNSTCQDDDHIRWEATDNELVIPESGKSVVCGAVPYISPRSILDDLFPPIFPQDTATISASGKTELQQRSVPNENELTWLADVIKTMDGDDDA